MIKAILYDLDGCLCDCVEIHFDAFNMALQEVSGTKIEKAEEEDFNGLPTFKKLEKLTEQGRVLSSDHQLVWQKKQDYTIVAIKKHLHLDPVKIALHEYTKSLGIASACVTNSITDTAQLMLECSGQWKYMDFLISNQMVKNPKPHGEGYIRAMIRLGVFPEETIIVEDSIRGIEAAESTGAHVLKVENSHDVTAEILLEMINGRQK